MNYEVYKGDERYDAEQHKDYLRNWEIDKILGSSSLRGPSSIDLGWNGFVIERHSVEEGERAEEFSDHHFVVLWDVHSCHGERTDPNGRFIPYLRHPGAISLFPAGAIPALRKLTKWK
jgi:hypothetical protein